VIFAVYSDSTNQQKDRTESESVRPAIQSF
jgi:hypothetical protein